MPLYVDACRLVHVNGAKKHKWVTISTESKMLGLAGEYSRFDLAHGVSREHARIMTPDNFSSIWVEDQKSRKGTYLCIGGSGKPAETFPVFPDVCLRLSKSNFYFFKPPQIQKKAAVVESSSEEEDDDDDDDDDDEDEDEEEEEDDDSSLDDHDAELDHGEDLKIVHRIMIKYRGPTTKQQTEIVISGTTTVGTSPTCDITVVDDEMDDHHCTIELDEASGVFFVRPTKSANGTYVKLSEKTPFELNFGDVLRLSDSRLSFGLARVCTLFKTLDDLFISTAMFLFQIKDLESKTKKLEALGGYRSVWERYKNYRKRAGKRNDPPIDEKGWKCEYKAPESLFSKTR